MTTRLLRTRLLAALPMAALALAARPAASQQDPQEWLERCRRNWDAGRTQAFCEVRETRLRPGGTLHVDGRQNGGVAVYGWDRDEVLVRARVEAHARSTDDARRVAQAIRVETGTSSVHATGPENSRGQRWSVSYDVFVPRRSNVQAEAHNGPIAVRGVSGDLSLTTANGPLALHDVSGNVRGRTQNGPVSVDLTGPGWNGAGLDVETTNGPVSLRIPEDFNARVESGTTVGPIQSSLPVTRNGRMGGHISTTVGRGGPTVRVMTTNGPVVVRQGDGRSRR